MTWLSLVLGFVKLANAIMSYMERRELIEAGEQRAINRAFVLLEGRVKQAMEARRNVDPGGVGTDPDNRDNRV